jgi:hypothetical protein
MPVAFPHVMMTIQLDATQAQFLDELLQTTRMQLRIESARADSHDFREMLHSRERLVESLIAQLREVRRAA